MLTDMDCVSMVYYTNYDEYVNSRWLLAAMLNFSQCDIFPLLLAIAS